MKTSPEGPREFQNRLLRIGKRASGTPELLELRELVSGLKWELHRLLRENIRLQVSDSSDAGGRVKVLRCDIEDLIRHLVLDARDAMPAGGELCILTCRLALDAEYARTHPEVPPGNYAMLAIRDTGDGSNAEGLKSFNRKVAIRKGRSLGLTACYDVIDRLGGHLFVSRHAHETVIKVYLPEAGGIPTDSWADFGNDSQYWVGTCLGDALNGKSRYRGKFVVETDVLRSVAGIKAEPADAVIAAEITPDWWGPTAWGMLREDSPSQHRRGLFEHTKRTLCLSSDEARRRLSEYGRNEVEEVSRRPLPLMLVGEFIPFFAIILWIAAGLAFFSEWRSSRDACPTRWTSASLRLSHINSENT